MMVLAELTTNSDFSAVGQAIFFLILLEPV